MRRINDRPRPGECHVVYVPEGANMVCLLKRRHVTPEDCRGCENRPKSMRGMVL